MKALLIDDHALFRHGLRLLLNARFAPVQIREAADLAQARACLHSEPDIRFVLLDVHLGAVHGDGVNTLRECQCFAADRAIVAMADGDDPATMQAVLAHGAVGFLPKTAQPQVFEQVLRRVFIDSLSPALPLSPRRASQHESMDMIIDRLGLSPRQVDVLQLLVAGQPNKAICRELSLAESTIKTHLLGLFRKLGVNSRTEAVVAAVNIGLGQLPALQPSQSRQDLTSSNPRNL